MGWNLRVKCPYLYSVLNDHESEHDPGEVLDSSLRPTVAVFLHALPAELHCLGVDRVPELVVPDVDKLEGWKLDDQYGTGVSAVSQQLRISLDRRVVPQDFLADQIGNFVAEVVLPVRTDANL